MTVVMQCVTSPVMAQCLMLFDVRVQKNFEKKVEKVNFFQLVNIGS